MKNQLGMSLSEVLISLFLASVIMTTLIQFYLNSKQQYLESEKVLSRCFDLQWVSDLLSDSIRRAGFTPCLGLDQLLVVDHRQGHKKIDALHIENQPQQFIQVNRMNEHFAKVIKIESPTRILIQNLAALHANRPILIADCEHAEIHELLSIEQRVNGSLIRLRKPLNFSYFKSVYVGEFLEERWFIKKNAKEHNTLHYHSVQTEELSSEIHSLQTKQDMQNKHLLEVNLGLDDGKTHKLIVMVRGS